MPTWPRQGQPGILTHRPAHSTTDSGRLVALLKAYDAVRGPKNPAEGRARRTRPSTDSSVRVFVQESRADLPHADPTRAKQSRSEVETERPPHCSTKVILCM
ncbi:hypothetical protein BHM03_00024711 [Ensete ventricosum]|nr:hypothetical protein BHM03_00024711 [Ensete ventricosum]